jgi:hypothetical protein
MDCAVAEATSEATRMMDLNMMCEERMGWS